MTKSLKRLVLLVGLLLAVGVLGACARQPTADKQDQKEAPKQELTPELFKVDPADKELVFQYFDGEGRPHVVTSLDGVPEAEKPNVMVIYPTKRRQGLPASLMILADLAKPGADGKYSVRFVNRYEFKPTGAAQTVSPGQVQSAGVVLFTAPGCPHCRHAREWLTAQAIPFVEKDLSKDPSAIDQALAAGKAQGVPESYLSSVPLLLVNGKLLVGFSEDSVRRALAGGK